MSFSPSSAPNLGTLGVTLREATPEDSGFLMDLFVQVRSHVFSPLGMSADQLKPLLDMQYLGRERQYESDFPEAVTYILERTGEPIGACIVCAKSDYLHLADISIAQENQGTGIGRAFLDDLKKQTSRVSLRVESLSPARRLYERAGFKETSDDGMYASLEWTCGV